MTIIDQQEHSDVIPAVVLNDPDKASVAHMIVAAARNVKDAKLHWYCSRFTRGWEAVIEIGDDQVMVEPYHVKFGARIEDPNGREYYYETEKALVSTLRGRFSRMRAATKAEEERRAEKKRRLDLAYRKEREAKALLVQSFGAELVAAAVFVDHRWEKDELLIHITVFVGRRIKGEKLNVVEASRFITAMLTAGYDLIKLADETA